MASRLQAFTIINTHKQDANPALFAEVSRGLKEETLQAALDELDPLAADLGYELDDEPVLTDKAVPDKNDIDLTEGLVAYYPFEDGSVTDKSGNSYNGVAFNITLAPNIFGELGAYHFNGVDSYVEIPNTNNVFNDISSSWTISFLARSEFLQKAPLVYKLARAGTNEDTFYFSINGEAFCFKTERASNDADLSVCSDTHIQTGVFYHVVGQYNGERLKIFVDGFLENINSVGKVVPYTGGCPLRIGNNPYSTHVDLQIFNGDVDEIRFYNRPLSSKEILALYEHDTTLPLSLSRTPSSSPKPSPSALASPSMPASPSRAASPSTPASASPDGNIHIEIDRNVLLIAMAAFAGVSAGALGVLCICACKQRQDAVQNRHHQFVDEDTPRAVAVNVEMVRPSSVSQAPRATLFQPVQIQRNERQTNNKVWRNCSMM